MSQRAFLPLRSDLPHASGAGLAAQRCLSAVTARMSTAIAVVMATFITTLAATPAQALTLSSAELAAAERLGCVLADDALGYLNEEQFNRRFDEAVTDFSEAQVDVIYAKALGYIDGLLYGVPSGETQVAAKRLESFSNSGRCDGGLSAAARTVSL